MPVVATLLSVAILLWVGSCPAQLLFHAAWEKMTAQNPPVTNGVLGRKQGVPHSTRMIYDGPPLAEALEVAESRVLGWAASFSTTHQEGLGLGQIFVNPLHQQHKAGSEVSFAP